jgi:hypothetical protein
MLVADKERNSGVAHDKHGTTKCLVLVCVFRFGKPIFDVTYVVR